MSYWTDFRDTVAQASGISSGAQAAQTAASVAGSVISAASSKSEAKQAVEPSSQPVSATAAVNGTKSYSWLSGVGGVVVLGVILFVILRRR